MLFLENPAACSSVSVVLWFLVHDVLTSCSTAVAQNCHFWNVLLKSATESISRSPESVLPSPDSGIGAAAAQQRDDVRCDDAFPACVLLKPKSVPAARAGPCTHSLLHAHGMGCVCAVSYGTGKQALHVRHHHVKM